LVSTRPGDTRDIMVLGLKQSYDYLEDHNDLDPKRSAFSDVGLDLGLYPNRDFGFHFDANYDAENRDFSSWGIDNTIRDDRGDAIRGRFTFIDNQVSQLDGNVEIVLSDRLKVGYYGKFDDLESEFVESKVALRIMSACNCWSIDLGYHDRLNPDKQQYTLSFTLAGLGEIGS
ncbi:MAG: LPS assembly protein LptD, partial [Bdellovibrionales bacterium]|nr:LPS assembly protein LptD [Bdellovibrionales bacterium]